MKKKILVLLVLLLMLVVNVNVINAETYNNFNENAITSCGNGKMTDTLRVS